MSLNTSHKQIAFGMTAFTLGCFVFLYLRLFGFSLLVSPFTQYQKPVFEVWQTWDNKRASRIAEYERLNGRNNIELVVRLALKQPFIQNLYCDVLRSSSIFWNSTLLGGFLLIFDEADRKRAPEFIKGLESIPKLPHYFRPYYEKTLPNLKELDVYAKPLGKPLEYLNQLYSSFLMDLYTDKPILAWMDSDATFTTPVLPEDIMNSKGQLIVKGWNSFHLGHVAMWSETTQDAVGFPMFSDFMTYFPMFLYTKTIRNCRNHIIKHLNVSTFEEAYRILIKKSFFSPCNVIMTYAYYYEYDSYEWHIDLRHAPLDIYNDKHCPLKPLGLKDITPAIHLSAHRQFSFAPLERAICSMNYHNGFNLTKNCKEIVKRNDLQLFEFDKTVTHFDTWCHPRNFDCAEIVEKHYRKFRQEIKEGIKEYDPRIVRDVEKYPVEKSFNEHFKMECPKINDVL